MVEIKQYDSKEVLFDSMAEQISKLVESATAKGTTALVVSGGTTPRPLFERLASMPLAWDKVTFVPSDERWLATDHPASNENLIRQSLLQDKASSAKVQGLKLNYPSAAAAEAELNQQLSNTLDSYAVAVVGMGLDGHFASIFPGTKAMTDALDKNAKSLCYAVDATGCPVAGEYTERMTLSMPAILNADHIFILITGAEKLALVENALKQEAEVAKLPISQLLQQNQTAVTVCCA